MQSAVSLSDPTAPPRYRFDDLTLDVGQCRLWRDETPIQLSRLSFEFLRTLVEAAPNLVTFEKLAAHVWGPRRIVTPENVAKRAMLLRNALDDHADQPRYLEAVRGRGYRVIPDVTLLSADVESPLSLHEPTASHTRLRVGRMFAVGLIGLSTLAAVLAVDRWVSNRTAAGVAVSSELPSALVSSAPPGLGPVTGISPVTTYPGEELSPAMSSDGRLAAFSWNGADGNRDIYVIEIGSANPLRLTEDPAADGDPAWSPDGTQIAFLRKHSPRDSDVFVVPTFGGPERKLQSVRIDSISREGAPRLAWAPDGSQLILTTRMANQNDSPSYPLHALSLDTGELRALSHTPGVYDTSPAVSPNGRWLAFTRFDISKRLSEPMVQELGPGLIPAAEPYPVPGVAPGLFHSLSWSPDGRCLVFIDRSQILEWAVGGKVRTVYTTTAALQSMSLTWQPTATRAVGAQFDIDSDIWVLPLDPLTHAALGPPARRVKSTSFDRHPRFSPDGRQLAFVSGRSGKTAIWVADTNGTNPRQLTDLDAVVSGFPRWSPDGRHMVFHASFPEEPRHIYMVDIDSGLTKRLFPGATPTWSADGQYIYVTEVADVNSVARVRIADGKRERLFSGDLPIETSDGQYLLYAKIEQFGIFRRSIASPWANEFEERLVDDYTPTMAGIVPDSDGFFYLGHTTEGVPRAFRFYDYATQTARDIAPAPASTGLGLTVARDGRELLYSAMGNDSGADLVLFEFAQAGPSPGNEFSGFR